MICNLCLENGCRYQIYELIFNRLCIFRSSYVCLISDTRFSVSLFKDNCLKSASSDFYLYTQKCSLFFKYRPIPPLSPKKEKKNYSDMKQSISLTHFCQFSIINQFLLLIKPN